MKTSTATPFEPHPYQLTAMERIRAMPVQFFWPPAPRLAIVVSAIIITTKATAK